MASLLPNMDKQTKACNAVVAEQRMEFGEKWISRFNGVTAAEADEWELLPTLIYCYRKDWAAKDLMKKLIFILDLGVNVDHHTIRGAPALHEALFNNFDQVALELIRRGADVNLAKNGYDLSRKCPLDFCFDIFDQNRTFCSQATLDALFEKGAYKHRKGTEKAIRFAGYWDRIEKNTPPGESPTFYDSWEKPRPATLIDKPILLMTHENT